jgi:hypothetical protein
MTRADYWYEISRLRVPVKELTPRAGFWLKLGAA